MSDVAHRGTPDGAFRLRTVAALLAVGVIGFLGSLVLGAYAPQLRLGHNGGAHALSNAAVGYGGLVRLAEATGRSVRVLRDDRSFGDDELLIITPETGLVDVSKALERAAPTLVVLPKWDTTSDPDHGGWVRYQGLSSAWNANGVLAPAHRLKIGHHRSGGRSLLTAAALPGSMRFTAPRPLQVICGQTVVSTGAAGKRRTDRLTPLITDDAGNIVLGRFEGSALYVLADPDLLSNQGIKAEPQAAAALALLDWLARGTGGVAFDVTLNGLGRGRSPLLLAFEPPGLAMTMSILAALLLAGWHALGRFGAPEPRERTLAFGKAALVDNAAALVRKAGRQARLGGRYADVMRERASAAFGVTARTGRAAVDEALARRGGPPRVSQLAAAATDARDTGELLTAAKALHEWRGRRT